MAEGDRKENETYSLFTDRNLDRLVMALVCHWDCILSDEALKAMIREKRAICEWL